MTEESKPFYQLTDHVCRGCFGRVLMRETFDHRRIYRCAQCGIPERAGKNETVFCCCGIKLKGGKDAGVRCKVNEDRSSEFTSEVMAEQEKVI
jgi:hypothetical protein